MFRSDKKLSTVLSMGLLVLICALSLCAFVSAADNGNSTVKVGAEKPVVDEVVLTDLLIQSGANQTMAGVVVKQAKVYVVNTTSAANAETDELHTLLKDLKVNKTVTKIVEDFAAAQSSTSNQVNNTSTN
jgi:hypothetical protein